MIFFIEMTIDCAIAHRWMIIFLIITDRFNTIIIIIIIEMNHLANENSSRRERWPGDHIRYLVVLLVQIMTMVEVVSDAIGKEKDSTAPRNQSFFPTYATSAFDRFMFIDC